MGVGTVVQGSYKADHWDETQAREGKISWYVRVHFETLLDPSQGLRMARLKQDVSKGMKWESQSSGISISEAIGHRLSAVWQALSDVGNGDVSPLTALLPVAPSRPGLPVHSLGQGGAVSETELPPGPESL